MHSKRPVSWPAVGPTARQRSRLRAKTQIIALILPPATSSMYRRLPPPFTLAQAADESPTLSRLAVLARESRERLKAVEILIPVGLRSAVQAGPVDGSGWCLLVESPSAAAKLRQLLPAIQERLKVRGWDVQSIRLKIQSR